MWKNKLNKVQESELFNTVKTRPCGLIVARQINTWMNYSYFSSVNEFVNYVLKIPTFERTFHEVVFKGKQKIKFDIDGKSSLFKDFSWMDVFKDLIYSLCYVCKKICVTKIKSENIILYSSSDADKISFHVIIDGFYVEKHNHSKRIAINTVNIMNPLYKQFVDMSVYSSTQNFRFPFCVKINSKRIKSLVIYKKKQYFTCDKMENAAIELIENSMVNVVKKGCKRMMLKACSETPRPMIKYTPTFERTEKHFNKARDHLGEDAFGFTVGGVEKNRIDLIRYTATYCSSCNRVHERENAYIYWTKIGIIEKTYFVCRRSGKPIMCFMPPEKERNKGIEYICK